MKSAHAVFILLVILVMGVVVTELYDVVIELLTAKVTESPLWGQVFKVESTDVDSIQWQ